MEDESPANEGEKQVERSKSQTEQVLNGKLSLLTPMAEHMLKIIPLLRPPQTSRGGWEPQGLTKEGSRIWSSTPSIDQKLI